MNVYQIITQQIIAQLEKGCIPWRQPWLSGWPMNYSTKREYTGLNAMFLAFLPYKLPYFLTFKQCQAMGGQVKKGEKGNIITFWSPLEQKKKTDEKEKGGEGEKKRKYVLRYYHVFNLEQCEGLPMPEEKTKPEPFAECERLIAAFSDAPIIQEGGARACYSPIEDTVKVPTKVSFSSVHEFYGTLFHELAHSTGHEKRLNREGIVKTHSFGDDVYSKEELIAEFGAAFLCGIAGIAPRVVDNSAAYIQHWLKALNEDSKLLISAASAAQKAADYIQGKRPDKE